ncbi:MAG TPA: hypothetical protein VLK85_16345 [Ramlibacter sp.]|nr:hypothetical protein [Ramlibacter sp.]
MNGAAARLRARSCLAGALVVVALIGCAAAVPVQPAQLQPLSAPMPDLQIKDPFEIRLSTGYTRVVPVSSWRAVGRLPQGVVYRPLNTVFAIEGRQVHEAYLVLQANRLQGFYLPGESNFSPLTSPRNFNQGERE